MTRRQKRRILPTVCFHAQENSVPARAGRSFTHERSKGWFAITNRPLTVKKQAFVRLFVTEAAGNGAQAAERAGWAKSGARVVACRLLKEPAIQAAITALREEIARLPDPAIADAAERRKILSGIARAGSNKKFAVPAIKAMDVLNKMDGLYVQKHEHAGPVHLVISPADARL